MTEMNYGEQHLLDQLQALRDEYHEKARPLVERLVHLRQTGIPVLTIMVGQAEVCNEGYSPLQWPNTVSAGPDGTGAHTHARVEAHNKTAIQIQAQLQEQRDWTRRVMTEQMRETLRRMR